jgi:uncharacterized protein YndB with AHSA1/START domain
MEPMVPESKARVLRKEVTVTASIDEVWQAWTTESGVVTFFAPEAKIDPCVGGPYEMYFAADAPPGSRGSEGCIIQELRPEERLVFSWNFPPTIPELRNAGARTRVTLTLQAAGKKMTALTLTQTGWQSGTAWDRGYEYFDRAWTVVLGRLKDRFEDGPIDWG